MENLLFLHGWGGNDKSFAAVEPYFRANFNCIFVRFPCFQKTDKDLPLKPYTLEDYAAEVVKTLDENKINKCHIIAHSFGCRVAVLLANSYPQRFGKLILTGPAGIPKRFSLRLKIKIWLHKIGIIKLRGSQDYRALTDIGKITFQNIIKRDLRPEIKKVKHRTLIIWGDRDSSVRRYMVKVWTNLNSNTKLIIYKGAGHFCYLDAPARFIIDAQEFLNV